MKIVRDAQTVWLWEGERESDSGVIKFRRADKSTLYLSLNNDPHLVLPVDIQTLGSLEQLTLEIDLTLLMDEQIAQEITVISETALNDTSASLTKPLERELEAANIRYAALQQATQEQLQLLSQRNLELEQLQLNSSLADELKEKTLKIQNLEASSPFSKCRKTRTSII